MTIEEIRKGAPFGATHYDDDGFYYKLNNESYKIWNDEDDMGFWDYIYCDINLIEVKPL